jgi:uncharacterized protein (DUF2062 family)
LALRDKLAAIFSIKDSPKKIAISFAVGVFIGMSPILGLHTVLGIAAAWIFRLNKFVTISGVYITNPWTIVPIYTFATWFGAKLLGVKKIIPAIDWNNISFNYLLNETSHLLLPFVFGTTLLGLLSAIAGYIIIYQAVMRSRQQ